jgi:hypothetical protein
VWIGKGGGANCLDACSWACFSRMFLMSLFSCRVEGLVVSSGCVEFVSRSNTMRKKNITLGSTILSTSTLGLETKSGIDVD